jgi:hypothetical protein
LSLGHSSCISRPLLHLLRAGHPGTAWARTSSRSRTPSAPWRYNRPTTRSHHTTHSVGNISNSRPLNSASPSSIVVGNGSTLLVTSVGDSVILGPFYLNNILLGPDIVQNLLFVRRFTTDNLCSMEFGPFGLSVKDLTTRNVIAQSNSTGPLYTLRLLSSTASSRTSLCVMSTIVASRILAAVATSTWHRCLDHPGCLI